MTESEKKLWKLLRNSQLGVHFRRQAPLGPYIVDFLCLKPKIAVELDGSQHNQREASVYDEERGSYLSQLGYLVLRFSDAEFLKNPRGVMQNLLEQLEIIK